MKRIFNNLALIAGLSVGTVAYAAPATWNFGTNPAQKWASGSTFNSTPGNTPIIVYAEQVNGSGVLQSTPDGSLNGLFSTSAAVEPGFESGIAPYNPQDNTYPHDNQGGTYNNQDGITNSNILELNVSAVTKGTSLAFLLEGPVGDDITVYTGDVSAPSNLGSLSVIDNSLATPIGSAVSQYGGIISPTGTSTIFSVTRDSAANEFIAIQADCHYLLLDSIIDSPAPTPEPRFYGLLLVGMLGVGVVLRRRPVPQQEA